MAAQEHGSMLDEAIAAATRRVIERGTSYASDKDLILAGFGWLASQLHHHSNGNDNRRQRLIRSGTPWAGGAGLAAVAIEALRIIFGA